MYLKFIMCIKIMKYIPNIYVSKMNKYLLYFYAHFEYDY